MFFLQNSIQTLKSKYELHNVYSVSFSVIVLCVTVQTLNQIFFAWLNYKSTYNVYMDMYFYSYQVWLNLMFNILDCAIYNYKYYVYRPCNFQDDFLGPVNEVRYPGYPGWEEEAKTGGVGEEEATRGSYRYFAVIFCL